MQKKQINKIYNDKFLAEIADNYVTDVLNTACELSKHKKSEYLTTSDLEVAMSKYKKFNFIK